MFETTQILLTQISRNLFNKIKTAPILYSWFFIMMIFSILMMAALTYFVILTETELSLHDLFFTIFFLFVIKSSVDLHRYYIKSPPTTYALSTQTPHQTTLLNIITTILLINLIIWLFFSTLYLIFISTIHLQINHPTLYLIFLIGILHAILIGCTITIHLFSPHRQRLIPLILLFILFWLTQDMTLAALTLPFTLIYLLISLRQSLDSFLFTNRKPRTKDAAQLTPQSIIKTIFHRELIILWRDKLLLSFIITSITTALGTGYLILHGIDFFIPDPFKDTAQRLLPQMFIFLGIYVVTFYTAVFPALNLFLAEEHTLWILRHLPISNKTWVYGKSLTLTICFLTTLPFIAYILLFTPLENLPLIIWQLVVSYLAATIISLPLGAKYIGKKSDIFLLYSIGMILLIIQGFTYGVGRILINEPHLTIIIPAVLFTEFLILFVVMNISSKILTQTTYPNLTK